MGRFSLPKSASQEIKAKGLKWNASSFIVRYEPSVHNQQVRLAIIVSKKQGKAVARNRIRRRLRHAFQNIMKCQDVGGDYLIVARGAVLTQPFEAVLTDIQWCLKHLKRLSNEKKAPL